MNLKETAIHIDICAIDKHVLLLCLLNRQSLKTTATRSISLEQILT
jgi:hypothetical protein